jgi:hypothetical protein
VSSPFSIIFLEDLKKNIFLKKIFFFKYFLKVLKTDLTKITRNLTKTSKYLETQSFLEIFLQNWLRNLRNS